jgi:putative phage-type endonuclease
MLRSSTIIDRLLASGMKDVCLIADAATALSISNVSAIDVVQRMEKHKEWSEQVERLAKIPQPAQRSEEWYNTRWNLITASDIAQALEEGKFGTQKDFLIKKCDPESAGSFNANLPPLVWGVKYEPVANALYEFRTGQRVLEFGLLKHPTLDFIGASPDGITQQGIMLEIKCPWRRKITGEIPRQYYYQIQAQLDVCGLCECDFLEVGLAEYPSEAEFVADGPEYGGRTSEGNEKGILIEYMDSGNRSYEYSKIGADVHELLEWRDSVLECRPGGKVVFWRVDVFSVVRVVKDEFFVTEMYAKARVVWDTVLRYRQDPDALRKELLGEKKKRSAPAVAAKHACPLLSDEDD